MKKKCINELVLILVLGNFIFFYMLHIEEWNISLGKVLFFW